VCAGIACAESWDDIALYGRSKLAWLRTFLELPTGIPSHDTFRRVFMLIDPDAFETGFATWVGALTAGFEREVMAINGKTIRRSFDHGREQSPLHVVSAWAKLVKVPAAKRVEYQRREASRASCWASAALTASRTRSPPYLNCWTNSRCRTASSPWMRWAELAKKVPSAKPMEGQRRVPNRDCREDPGTRRRLVPRVIHNVG